MWLGKYQIIDDEDIEELENRAAILELKQGMLRDAAEHKAYQDYTRIRAIKSLAHHYLGMRLAEAVNDEEAARSHATQYQTALAAGGFEEGEVPQEVLDFIQGNTESPYKFKNHPNDVLFPVAKPEESVEDKVLKLISIIEEVKGQI